MTIERVITDDDLLEVIRDHRGKEVDDIDALREIEQAVLQSPEIRALRKDAGRYRWLRKPTSHVPITHAAAKDSDLYDAEIDAAMEKQI